MRNLSKIWEPRFLIVDDDESLRFLLSDLLHNRGVVESAQDGRDALEKSEAAIFQCNRLGHYYASNERSRFLPGSS